MLTAEDIDKVKLTMRTAGWNEVMLQRVADRIRAKIKILLLHPSERREPERDDNVLRAQIAELQWFVEYWDAEIQAHEINRKADELRDREMNGSEDFGSVPLANP
jgi:hypothetical protein